MDLTNHFIIAMPGLADPSFARTVSYICQHDSQGAMGLTINRPIDIPFSELLSQLNIPLKNSALATTPIYQGGPIDTGHGFILHTNEFSVTKDKAENNVENGPGNALENALQNSLQNSLQNKATHYASQTLKINDYLSISSSTEILSAIARDEGPEKYLIALGYSGWGIGQLEREISENAWLNVPADQQIIFDTPDNLRWETAARQMGIDIHLISSESGHA
jgi:putative transcriptional regulator